jgi:RNA polymerase sigma-70 factor, ECF subfamily
MNYEARLVRRFQQGDARALEELFELYLDRALGLAVRLTETREDAEEVTQEAFLRAFRRAKSFRGETSERKEQGAGDASVALFGAWLFAIVRNVAADRRRQLRLPVLPLDAEDLDGLSVGDETQRHTNRIVLHRALESLPEEYRLVLTLCDMEDISHADAAKILGKSVPATKSLVYRARRALRDLLIDSED